MLRSRLAPTTALVILALLTAPVAHAASGGPAKATSIDAGATKAAPAVASDTASKSAHTGNAPKGTRTAKVSQSTPDESKKPLPKKTEPEDAPASQPLTAISLEELEERLVDTDAIGFFTKLELKSQLDDLTERFREFHEASDADELPRLREEFNGLLLKLLTLLQDEDPDLHRDLVRAKPQIWRTFSDPVQFAKL